MSTHVVRFAFFFAVVAANNFLEASAIEDKPTADDDCANVHEKI